MAVRGQLISGLPSVQSAWHTGFSCRRGRSATPGMSSLSLLPAETTVLIPHDNLGPTIHHIDTMALINRPKPLTVDTIATCLITTL